MYHQILSIRKAMYVHNFYTRKPFGAISIFKFKD